MSKKYDIHICGCGRIHAIPYDTVVNQCYTGEDNNGDIALICSRCGKMIIIGADYGPDWDSESDKGCYTCYTTDHTPSIGEIKEITPDMFNKKTKVLYSAGYPVPMMSGEYANSYSSYGSGFADMSVPLFYEIQRNDISAKEILDWIENNQKARHTVNMDFLMSELPEDVVEELSHYYIKQLDWTGTKYETK